MRQPAGTVLPSCSLVEQVRWATAAHWSSGSQTPLFPTPMGEGGRGGVTVAKLRLSHCISTAEDYTFRGAQIHQAAPSPPTPVTPSGHVFGARLDEAVPTADSHMTFHAVSKGISVILSVSCVWGSNTGWWSLLSLVGDVFRTV